MPVALNELIDGLAESGYAVVPHAITPQGIAALQDLLQTSRANSLFKPAAIGKDHNKTRNETIRGDVSLWIDDWSANGGTREFYELVQAIMQELKQSLYIQAKRFEGHLAIYPPGAGYQAHLDQHAGKSHRQLSLVLYLNDLNEGGGGELKIHNTLHQKQTDIKITPRAGTLVTFLSAKIVHEVLPTTRERWSLTGWIRDDEEPT